MPSRKEHYSDEPELEWCDYEPGDFPESQFHDSVAHGRLHVRRGTPLHTNRGGLVHGITFPEGLRAELDEKFGPGLIDEVLSQ
jgi:hypothetical protein